MSDWVAEDWPLRLVCGYARAVPELRGKARLLRGLLRVLYPHGGWLRSAEGVRFHVDPAEYIGWAMLNAGAFESQSLRLATSLMRGAAGHAFLDVGANQGLFTCAVGSDSGCPVISIEAAPEAFLQLQRNVRGNEALRATLVHACAARAAGVVEFFVPRDRHLAAWAGPKPKASVTREGLESFWAAAAPLETILRGLSAPRVHVLKIDVEGFELEVFGGLEWSGAFRPRHIIMECDPHEREKIEYLEAQGYVARLVTGQAAAGLREFPEGNLWFEDRRVSR